MTGGQGGEFGGRMEEAAAGSVCGGAEARMES